MYQNGRQVNHHAAQIEHKRRQKENMTPDYYNSYKEFIEDMRNKGFDFNDKWWQDDKWNRKTFSSGWSHNLKEEAHMKERAYYNGQLHELLKAIIEDLEDCELPLFSIFGDPWRWD